MLSTERLELRRFRPEDAAAFAAYRSDPEIARFQSWEVPYPQERAAALIAEFGTDDPTAPGWFQYAIELRSEQALIGDIGVNLDDNLMQAEIGFTLAAAYQGRGYALEAVRAILDHLFTERGLRRVAAECDARNVRSATLLERAGFRPEGRRLSSTYLKGEWTDDLLFGLLAPDTP